MINPHNLYIHVPYCASRCNYCAFYTNACDAPDWDGYCNKITAEINHWHKTLGKITVPTIFFGGGTPSLMPTDIFAKIMGAIQNAFCISDNCEITLESNPGTINQKRLIEFKNAGITRLSIGIQSLDDDELQFLGRRHTAKQATDLIAMANDIGIDVSGDFIYGLPTQSVLSVQNMCLAINKLGLKHCSMYELTIEENTPFGKMNLDMPDNETMAEMYDMINDTLDLPRYEVSNYAAKGAECKHNVNIWDGDAYIGIGRAAAGRVYMDNVWYEQMGDGQEFKPITNADRAVEKLLTGMRQSRGTKLTTDVINQIDMEFVKNNPDLITQSENRIIATLKGILILDNLLLRLIK